MFEIRPIAELDVHRAALVLLEMLEEHRNAAPDVYELRLLPPDVAALEAHLRTSLVRGNLQLVAVFDGDVVGVLDTKTIELEASPLSQAEKIVRITFVGVLQQHRSKGLGTRLIKAALEAASEVGATKVTLAVWPHNRAASRLYERMGFTVTSEEMAIQLTD